jgi:hypothetical protein
MKESAGTVYFRKIWALVGLVTALRSAELLHKPPERLELLRHKLEKGIAELPGVIESGKSESGPNPSDADIRLHCSSDPRIGRGGNPFLGRGR